MAAAFDNFFAEMLQAKPAAGQRAHPPPLVGAGGVGVGRTEEIIEYAIASSSRRAGRPPSSILPHRGETQRSDPRVNSSKRL